jgi:hypothetical protein
MRPSSQGPIIPTRYRTVLIGLEVVIAVGLFFLLRGTGMMGAAFTAIGVGLIGVVSVDHYTLAERQRDGLLHVGTFILGLGLAGLGIYLLIR